MYALISSVKQRNKIEVIIFGVIFKTLYNSKHSGLSIYFMQLLMSKNQNLFKAFSM